MSHVTQHCWPADRVINHIKEQIDNKRKVRKHPIRSYSTKLEWYPKKSANTDLLKICGKYTSL